MMLLSQALHLVISSLGWLLFILACFVGLLSWLTYMALTQRKLLSKMVTRDDLPQIFEEFKKALENGK